MDNRFMKIALLEANKAYNNSDVPVGAIIVYKNKIISKGYNKREKQQNVLKHAELIAIDKACKKLKSWRLNDCIIYTTLFPCPMCAAAIQQARISKIVYLDDSNNKFINDISTNILNNEENNYRVKIEKINMQSDLIRIFFNNLRIDK
ncbi:MAG: nucleoside deaminase [Bacilli bacterium]